MVIVPKKGHWVFAGGFVASHLVNMNMMLMIIINSKSSHGGDRTGPEEEELNM